MGRMQKRHEKTTSKVLLLTALLNLVTVLIKLIDSIIEALN